MQIVDTVVGVASELAVHDDLGREPTVVSRDPEGLEDILHVLLAGFVRLNALGCHERRQISGAAGVAPLVVVPADYFDHLVVD